MGFMRWTGGMMAVAVTCGMALAGPTDGEVRQKIDEFSAWASTVKPTQQREFKTRLNELVSAYEPSELTTAQIGMLGQYYVRDGSKIVEAFNEVDGRTGGDTPAAAAAEVVAAWLWMFQQRTPPSPDELRQVLSHPGLNGAIKGGVGGQAYGLAGTFATNHPPQVVRPLLPDLLKLSKSIPDATGYEAALGAKTLYEAVSPMIDNRDVDAAFKSRVTQALARAKDELPEGMGHVAKAIDEASKQLNFIGGTAPELRFGWTSEGLDAASIGDLKGNVVVLDFWATWCAPCIATFPRIGELVERYEGYPVKVIGVTSVQGRHVNPDGTRVSTQGDPDKEYALMSEFMAAKGMTWDVAFTENPQDNDAYYVRTIPHLAFIAPDGTVRINGVNPHSLSKQEEYAIIDGLLDEFKLPKPKD